MLDFLKDQFQIPWMGIFFFASIGVILIVFALIVFREILKERDEKIESLRKRNEDLWKEKSSLRSDLNKLQMEWDELWSMKGVAYDEKYHFISPDEEHWFKVTDTGLEPATADEVATVMAWRTASELGFNPALLEKLGPLFTHRVAPELDLDGQDEASPTSEGPREEPATI